jgi:uncharacterized protein YxeA
MKKGVSLLVASILLILLVIACIGIIYGAVKPMIDKQNCFQNYAKDYCIKKNMTFYKSDTQAGNFSCWTNKTKKETKTFYPKGVCP